ncbi:site-specific integrase [Spirosoma harenae]
MLTQQPLSFSLNRQRMELALMFELPAQLNQGLCELQCQLRVDGTTCPPYGSGVFVLALQWNADLQKLEGFPSETLVINRTLSEIRGQHRQLMQDLIRADQRPTATLVHYHWTTGELISPQLMVVFEEYMTYLNRVPLSERKNKSTLHKWYLAHRHLREYLNQTHRPTLPLSEVTPVWGRNFYHWMRENDQSEDSAARYFCFVRETLHYAVERDMIAYNKLQSMEITREATKVVMCLSPEQVEELAGLEELPPLLNQVRLWALFCCYTGLDYTDAVAFARDPTPHIHTLPYGEKIVWRRLKFHQIKRALPEWGFSHIPLLPETKRLLLQIHEWTPLSSQRMNQNLRKLEQRLNLSFRLTTKVCRKTAGALFLIRGYQAEAVRKILGIRTLAVFERCYLSLLSDLVDINMERLSRDPSLPANLQGGGLVEGFNPTGSGKS